MSFDANITAYSASYAGCSFYSNSFKYTQCEIIKNIAVAKKFDQMQPKNINLFIEYIKNRTNDGYKVILFKQVPRLFNRNKYLDEKYMDTYLSGNMENKTTDIDVRYMKYNSTIDKSLDGLDDVFLLEPSNVLCKNDLCNILDDNDFPLYYDDNHFSAYRSE